MAAEALSGAEGKDDIEFVVAFVAVATGNGASFGNSEVDN
jgi:hypothetical protein